MTRDPLDDLGPRDRGLIELFNQLTSEPTADELAGEYAAVTMFRTAREAAPAAAPPAVARRRRRTSGARIGARLAAAATVVALGGGFAAAGYAEVLPAPLQHVAHQILGFAGIPNSPGKPGSSKATVPVTSHRTTGGTGSPGGSRSTQPSSPTQPSSSGGRSHSPSSHHSHSASPSPSQSSPPVVATITVSQVPSAHGQSVLLVVSTTQARRGDTVVLEYQANGQWKELRTTRLRRGGQTKFSVVPRKISVVYRVVLPATAKHTQAVSGPITVAARPKKGGPGRH